MSRLGYHLLGLLLLHCDRCGGLREDIDVTIHSGNVGQCVSYNYPFVYTNGHYKDFNYRLFINNENATSVCLTFHRFDMRYGGQLRIRSDNYGSATYHRTGILESLSSDKGQGVFPSTLWWTPFCVPLSYGQKQKYLEVTFTHYGYDVGGFQFDYSESSMHIIAEVHPTPKENYLNDKFVCYDRSEVPTSRICDGNNDCKDSTDETFAHAQCTDTYKNRPSQRPGIWACNFDNGVCSTDMYMSTSWKVASSVASDEEGPKTDHTHSSSGKPGKFAYTDFGYILSTTLRFDPKIPDHQNSCLSFWYFMAGNDPGKLSVRWISGRQLWQRIGSHGNKWLNGQVNLKRPNGYYNPIEFVAERGSNEESRISLDDISVLPGLCPYTDGGFTAPGWDFDDCDTDYSYRNNSIRCNQKKDDSVITSPMIASGKCLVLTVQFPYWVSSVTVYQQTIGKSLSIGEITKDYSNKVETKKLDIKSVSPFKIRLLLKSYQGHSISVQNFYVVDNDCDNISLGSCRSYEFYCSEEQCIDNYRKCDGIRDCFNGNDEKNCAQAFPGVTVATGLIGTCIFILLGLTCVLYSINKKSTQRAHEARTRRNEEQSIRRQMFVVEDWEQGTNPGFSFNDPDNLPPSYTDLVADGIVVPGGPSEDNDTADSTSLPPYDDFLTGNFVELNPTTLKPVNQPNE